MQRSLLVLTEQALSPADAQRLADLHPEDDVTCRLLLAADPDRSLLVDVLDHLSLFELRDALAALRGPRRDQADPPSSDAASVLEVSLAAARQVGLTARGQVVEGDPVQAVAAALDDELADELLVLTRPHAVEDTFHTDWASRARERFGLPVLHLYADTGWVG